jgi:DNA polymerase III subunit delta'
MVVRLSTSARDRQECLSHQCRNVTDALMKNKNPDLPSPLPRAVVCDKTVRVSRFADILDQKHAVQWLQRAYEVDRLPHGLIFAGPTGVGKGTTAAALGALVLCENPQRDDSCGKCESCRLVAAGNHPDYRVIMKELIRSYDKTGESKAVEFSIEVIRHELVERAGRTTVMGRGKMFVIERAEMMTLAAQNAMLKVLEEPAERNIIVLLTDQPTLLLPTVRSRCQLVRFAPLPEEMVRRELEKRGIDERLAASAATLSEGSLGIAIKWIEDGVVTPAEELIGKLQSAGKGTPLSGLADWLKKAADAYAEKQLKRDELTSKAQAARDGLAVYLRVAAEHFRRLLERSASADDTERAASAIDAITRAEQYLDSYVNTPLVLQQLTLALETSFALVARTED